MTDRVLVGYDDCRCILTQYCDGNCRPVYAHRPLRASSPPVPQQLAKLKSALYDISSGDFDATDDEVRALMCVIQEMHIDQRLRDIKTNQEIDAMVREMKQPSEAERYRAVLEEIAGMTFDEWTNGAIAGRMAQKALAARTPTDAGGAK